MAGLDGAAAPDVLQACHFPAVADRPEAHPCLDAAGIPCARRWWDVDHGAARPVADIADAIPEDHLLPGLRAAGAGKSAGHAPRHLAAGPAAVHEPAMAEPADAAAALCKQDADRSAA